MDNEGQHWDIVPWGMFSRHFDLKQAGVVVVALEMGLWSEGCTFTIADHAFTIRKVSVWKDGFQLVTAGQSVCDVRRSLWSRRFELQAGDDRWTLQPASWLSRDYVLVANENSDGERTDGESFATQREIGRIWPAGWFTRRRIANFAAAVPPPVQVLAIFLVLVISRRQQRRSATT